jgi:hypothetical protein
VLISEKVIESINKGGRKVQCRGSISVCSIRREGFVQIKNRDNFSGCRDLVESME